MTSEIDKLKHFHIGNCPDCVFNKYLCYGLYKYHTDKMTASDYTHLFGYLNPYYRSAYNVSKRRK